MFTAYEDKLWFIFEGFVKYMSCREDFYHACNVGSSWDGLILPDPD